MTESGCDQSKGGWERGWVGALILVAATVAIYGQTVGFEVFRTWDDALFAFDRTTVQHWFRASWFERLLTPEIGYPIPIPTVLYSWVHQLPQSWVVPGLHAANVAFQVANVLLLQKVAARWLDSARLGWVAAAVWSVHPLLVESVAWVSNLKTLTFGTALFAAFLCWERYLDDPGPLTGTAVVALSVAALGCRPEGMVVPVALGARALLREDVDGGRRAIVAPILAALLPAVAYGWWGLQTHRSLVTSGGFEFAVYGGYDLVERLRRIFAALGLQSAHVLAPVGLQPGYMPDEGTLGTWWPVGVAVAVAGFAVAARSWRTNRAAFWGLFWAALFYAPVSGVEYLPRFTADTYLYVPLAGLAVAVVAGGAEILDERERSSVGVVAVGLTGIVLVLGVLSTIQTTRWESTETLFSYTIDQVPDAPKPYHILARDYLREGKFGRAGAVYRLGWEPIFETGFVDLTTLRAVERGRRPAEALRLGLQLYRPNYTGNPPENLDGYLMGVAVEHDLEWPSDSDRSLAQLARDVLERHQKSWSAERLAAAGRYLDDQGLSALAGEYVVAAVRKRPRRCAIWRAVDAVGVPVVQRSLPARPADCQGR